MAVVVYSLAFFVFGMMTTLHMNTLTLKHGFLDGQVPRDGIPDLRLKSTFVGLLFVMTVRPVFYCLVAYDRFQMPSITPWLPVHMFLFTTILYFWFYIYHRAMHEVDFLWKFHNTHHMAKHPNALLSAFASRLGDNLWLVKAYSHHSSIDREEEIFSFLVIPLLAYISFPVDFFTLWITSVYMLYAEVLGHSGIRLYQQQPVTGPVLRPFGMGLVGEDQWVLRSSISYGKQTRVWDKLFGTMRPRVEMLDENVDW
ncbi:hypothetical protein BS47DRAFT_1286368 [Hydnum rufescens UP504]|uniref:Fatty acid hydroxylase domain-containing protein n=1 Tax=Hydnum rufescens UP504 TaxID=1448309 RepID=A0A9P6DZX8_9AGAM|nr:hypothetical protein BS47DRAFT_1286368 [Hydnum rufescens UP504]